MASVQFQVMAEAAMTPRADGTSALVLHLSRLYRMISFQIDMFRSVRVKCNVVLCFVAYQYDL